MIMKECNSAAWLAEVRKRVDALVKLQEQEILGRAYGAIFESMYEQAHELVAAAQILRDEIAVESSANQQSQI